jgi:putative ribosome biogenesis GTPase RsgA
MRKPRVSLMRPQLLDRSLEIVEEATVSTAIAITKIDSTGRVD